jgi:TRAP-type C4-dicarboxylate transport system substrate-binding protein
VGFLSVIELILGEFYSPVNPGRFNLPIDVIYAQKFYESAKHVAMTGHFALTPPFFVSDKFMKKLSPEQKEAMYMAADIAAAAAREHTRVGLSGVRTKLDAAGVQFTEPDKAPFIAAAALVKDAFAKDRGEEYVKLVNAINAAAN